MADASGWFAVNIVSLTPTAQGLVVQIANNDPYLLGPTCDFPTNQSLRLHVRLKSDQGGEARLFYFHTEAQETNSVRFHVPPGQWYEATIAMPSLVGRWRLRFDPPGNGGLCILDRLWFDESVAPAPREPEPRVIRPVRGT